MNTRQSFVLLSIIMLIAIAWTKMYWMFVIVTPFILLGVYDLIQTRHTILRIYPVVGHLRYLFESMRPEIQQYFVESDISGRPISREFRALV